MSCDDDSIFWISIWCYNGGFGGLVWCFNGVLEVVVVFGVFGQLVKWRWCVEIEQIQICAMPHISKSFFLLQTKVTKPQSQMPSNSFHNNYFIWISGISYLSLSLSLRQRIKTSGLFQWTSGPRPKPLLAPTFFKGKIEITGHQYFLYFTTL